MTLETMINIVCHYKFIILHQQFIISPVFLLHLECVFCNCLIWERIRHKISCGFVKWEDSLPLTERRMVVVYCFVFLFERNEIFFCILILKLLSRLFSFLFYCFFFSPQMNRLSSDVLFEVCWVVMHQFSGVFTFET